MMDYKVKVGFAPTRRGAAFVNPDALKYKKMIQDRLTAWGVDFVDLDDVTGDGMLSCPENVEPVLDKLRAAKVDCLFFPHCNFGSEHSVAKVARALQLPTLIWGPRDEAPLPDGSRLRDTQCGIFATGKVLRRVNVPFTYLPNCRLDDDLFDRGFHAFLAVAYVVKEFRRARILQISTRPNDFWSVMVNESELLEKFGVQIFPIAMSDFADRVLKTAADTADREVAETEAYMRRALEICVSDEIVRRVAAMKVTIARYAGENGCNAVAIQCWDAMQNTLGMFPCCANAMLTDDGLPVACETDINGAITAIMAQAAGMGRSPSFFVDWSVRHPENDNGELLQHCGPWPLSLAREKPVLGTPLRLRQQLPRQRHRRDPRRRDLPDPLRRRPRGVRHASGHRPGHRGPEEPRHVPVGGDPRVAAGGDDARQGAVHPPRRGHPRQHPAHHPRGPDVPARRPRRLLQRRAAEGHRGLLAGPVTGLAQRGRGRKAPPPCRNGRKGVLRL